jgi:hypothetical protein
MEMIAQQGDQIGQIFARWVSGYILWAFFENKKSSPLFWASFFPTVKVML